MRLLIMVCFVLLTIFISLWSYNTYRFQYGISDALYRTLLAPLESTYWANGFSEKKFTSIKQGMTEKEVFEILGNPLRKTCVRECEWIYSWQRDPTSSFDWRSIYFNKGLVQRIDRRFFID